MSVLDGAVRVGLGLLIGTFGTLIGAGGGFILVPLLLLGYGFSPPEAVGTSLSLVCLNAISGTFAYLRQRRVDLALGWRFAAATLPGAIGGAFVTQALSSATFGRAFGVLLLAVAALLFVGRTAGPSAHAGTRTVIGRDGLVHVYQVDVWKGVVVSFVIGVISSVFGIGGGIIHVPFLIVFLGLPVHVATATSHFVLSISAGAGALAFLLLGHVQLPTVALVGTGILAGAQLGAHLSIGASAAVIRRILAGSLALVGVRMLLAGGRLGP